MRMLKSWETDVKKQEDIKSSSTRWKMFTRSRVTNDGVLTDHNQAQTVEENSLASSLPILEQLEVAATQIVSEGLSSTPTTKDNDNTWILEPDELKIQSMESLCKD